MKDEENVRPAWELASKAIDVVNCTFLATFLAETLVRAALSEGGCPAYFGSLWNVMDLAVIVASGTLEVVDLLDMLQVSHESTLVGIVRMVSSLRTVLMLHRSAIHAEALINYSRQVAVRDLQRTLAAKEDENARLADQANDYLKRSDKTSLQIDCLRTNILGSQRKSWNRLVPNSFHIGLTKKTIKARPKRSKSAYFHHLRDAHPIVTRRSAEFLRHD